MPHILRAAAVLAVAALVARGPAADAQVRPVYDLGAAGLTQVLQRLQTTASALHTGAHPDDEDSAFIARTARGDHARVAYLSLTRGEGGQNFIGTELFEGLGIIRSEELLQARRLDGGSQFFTRAIDFGFSKTRAEAAAKWGERALLADMVRVIRTFRPLVIVSRFTGTNADGHGHHQLAGYLTPIAYRAAADPSEFAEQLAEGLRPWQVRRLYQSARQPAQEGLLTLETGLFDPVIGRSYAEIASEGRSQHKSQEMGAIERRGDAQTFLRLVEAAQPPPATAGTTTTGRIGSTPFDGLDTTVRGIASLAGLPNDALRNELDTIASSAAQALDAYEPLDPAAIVPPLAAGLRATRDARRRLASLTEGPARADADFLLAIKEAEFQDALARAAGVVVDALANEELVTPGSELTVAARVFHPEGAPVRVTGSELVTPRGWSVRQAAETTAGGRGGGPGGGGPGGGAERARFAQSFVVSVPADAPVTQPYFLEQARDGDLYRWAAGTPATEPFAEGPIVARATLDIGSVPVTVSKRVDYRFADRVRGEIRRNVNVAPSLTVSVDSPLLIVPLGTTASEHEVVVTATNHTGGQVPATIRLRLPDGWTSTPRERSATLESANDRTVASFTVTAPAGRKPGRVEIVAEATTGGATYSRSMQTIAYPHIESHRLYRTAAVATQVVDLKVSPVNVGYVMGTGDQVPEALRRMGMTVTLLSEETLASGNLSVFDTIVVGVRASEARPDFPAEHARLLDYVRSGGTLIVQYQQTDYLQRNLPPIPVPPQGNSRVTNEDAPVRILVPDHPVFTFPNRITADDFAGWVQERNLYAFPSVPAGYTALLETADPGEDPQRGGQVYAEIGKGRYVYTAYSWFRQLPAGVPGAYRQFANLVNLSKAR